MHAPAMTARERGDGLYLAVLTVLLIAIALVNSLTVADDWRRRGEPLGFVEPLIWETSSIVVLLAIAPLFMAFMRGAWPLDPPWWRTSPVYLVAMLGFSLAHVTGMGVLRWAVYAAGGAH